MGLWFKASGRVKPIPIKEIKIEQPMRFLTGWLQNIADPGTGVAIPVTESGVVDIVTGGSGETNTLAVPTFEGQMLILTCMTKGAGARVITVADPHIDGTNNTITTAAAGNILMLMGRRLSTTTYGWALVFNVGFTLSHV